MACFTARITTDLRNSLLLPAPFIVSAAVGKMHPIDEHMDVPFNKQDPTGSKLP